MGFVVFYKGKQIKSYNIPNKDYKSLTYFYNERFLYNRVSGGKLDMDIINKLRIILIKPTIKKLNNKYFSTVRSDWEQVSYDETVYCYPIHESDADIPWSKGKVDFLTGLKLALASPDKQKVELVLAWFEKKDIDLIKRYVSLKGFDESIIKSS